MRLEKNQEKKGIELYFDAKPSKEVLDMLKLNGFRWHREKKCWYVKESEKTLKVAQKLEGVAA